MARDRRTLDERILDAAQDLPHGKSPDLAQAAALPMLRAVATADGATQINRAANDALAAIESGDTDRFEFKLRSQCERWLTAGHPLADQLQSVLGLLLLHQRRYDEFTAIGEELLARMPGDAKLSVVEFLDDAKKTLAA